MQGGGSWDMAGCGVLEEVLESGVSELQRKLKV